jgi:FkbM family methyltransferase
MKPEPAAAIVSERRAGVSEARLGLAPWWRLLTGRPFHQLAECRRLRRQCRRPLWALALRYYSGEPFLARIELRDGRYLWLRAGTDDPRIVASVFFNDDYRTEACPGRLSCVVDVGAHIGALSLRLAPRADRLLAFEAAPGTFGVLERNLSGTHAGIELFNKAVAERAGSVPLFVSPERTGKHSLFESLVKNAGDAVEVEAVVLPEILEARKVDRVSFLKLDCEGAEYGILRSLEAWGLERIERIAMEYHPLREEPSASGEGVEGRLRLAGFSVERLPHRHRSGRGMLYASRGEAAARPAQRT